MNPEDFSRQDLWETASPPLLGAILAVLALTWILSWKARNRFTAARWPLTLLGLVLITASFWTFFQLLSHWFALATSWPLLVLALVGGFAWEMIALIYQFERDLVSRRVGRLLVSLRLAALATLIIILLQPVRSFLEDREINREVAILIDNSESMHLSDQRLSPSEMFDRVSLFGGDESLPAKRPPLREIQGRAERLDETITAERSSIESSPSSASFVESRAELLPEILARWDSGIDEISKLVETAGSMGVSLEWSPVASDSLDLSNPDAYIEFFGSAADTLDRLLRSLDPAITQSDAALYESLLEPEKKAVEEISRKPRVRIARQSLNFPLKTVEGTTTTLLESLGDRYNLRFHRFNRDVVTMVSPDEWGDEDQVSQRAQTDLTGALEHILENSSPETLAGILLLSDGRHNAAELPEDSLRQLAIQNSPLCAVPIGGERGPVDISILGLEAPESIYLDDRVVVRCTAKMNDMLNREITAKLISNGKTVQEQKVKVTDVDYRVELRFVDTPEDKGIIDYQVALDIDEREIFKNNNHWDFKVAVTDDRTNVLLVDGLPRWEFRYLRNLFYGRDKSVHLQYVLLNPDTITGMKRPAPVSASARRRFGDAEATVLPESNEEWQLFDVIILGDIPPNRLSRRDWMAIQEAVTRRGALLVCVAGPRFMPHHFRNDIIKDLLPVTYRESNQPILASPEPAYQIALTSAGRVHPITSQSSSRALNIERWASFPELRWRWQAESIKESAEVLAFAESLDLSDEGNAPGGSPESVEAALRKLASEKEWQKQNALITTIRSGLGKVVMLNFDRTWRFRYGVGDTYHHRFWGQLTRWGAGPNLRSGNEQIRLGTDRISYTSNDPIEVTAKILDDRRQPVTGATVRARILDGDTRLSTQQLKYRENSSGIYEGVFTPLATEGDYEIEIEVEGAGDGTSTVRTEFLVVTARNPVELAELTADRDFLNRATTLTNGRVAEIWALDSLLDAFGSPKETLTERRDIPLWDTWPILLLFLLLLTSEWVVRRKSGLV